MKMISGFVDIYLKLNLAEEEIFKAEIAKFEIVKQEVVMEIVTSWQLQGRQEGELKVILRMLNRKLGSITPHQKEQIGQLSTTQLEDLTDALFDFTCPEDLVIWLDEI